MDAHAKGDARCEVVDGLLVVRLIGDVRPDTFIDAMDRVKADPQVPAGMPMLLDTRDTSRAPSRHEMERVVDYLVTNANFFSGRRAVIAGTLLQYGIARVAEALEDPQPNSVRAFRSEADAIAYLRAGMPPE